MKRRRISQWHISRLRAAHDRLGSIPKAADAVGVSYPTAYRVLADRVGPNGGFRQSVRRAALDLYASGLSCRAVAAKMKATHKTAPSHNTVFEWVKAEGILRDRSRADELQNARRQGRDYDAIRDEARRIADEKLWSIKRIAKHLGVSAKVVERAVDPEHRLDNSEARQRSAWQAYTPEAEARRAKRDRIIQLREQGMTYPAICKATGASPATVFVYCREAGLVRPLARRRSA